MKELSIALLSAIFTAAIFLVVGLLVMLKHPPLFLILVGSICLLFVTMCVAYTFQGWLEKL